MAPSLLMLMLLLQTASTLYMVGLIWFVQIVHYPLFAEVGREQAAKYSQRHQVLTTWVVGPPMLVEAGTSLALAWSPPAPIGSVPVLVGLALVLVIWISTAALSVPCHHILAGGHDERAQQRLVATNWIRTTAWTLRGALVLWMLAAICTYNLP